jgi:hypothetical protein
MRTTKTTSERTGNLTQEQADELFRASSYFDQLDDTGEVDEQGYWYYLEDGTFVLIDYTGKLTHGD